MAYIEYVKRVGSSLLAVFDDGTEISFARTNNHLWIPAKAASAGPGPGPGPDPDPQGLESPFVMAPSPDGDMPPVGHVDAPRAEYGPRALTGAFHEGIDLGWRNAVNGAVIHSAGAGTVLHDGAEGNWGNSIIIDHGANSNGDRLIIRYAHRQAPTGLQGATVSKGDPIGLVGATGAVFGPHLHMETHVTPDGVLRNDYNNPSYTSPRTTINPRDFFDIYG